MGAGTTSIQIAYVVEGELVAPGVFTSIPPPPPSQSADGQTIC